MAVVYQTIVPTAGASTCMLATVGAFTKQKSCVVSAVVGVPGSFTEIVTPTNGGSYFIRAFDNTNTTDSVTITYTMSGNLIIGTTLQGVPNQIVNSRLQNSVMPIDIRTKLLWIIVVVAVTFLIMLIVIAATHKNKRS